MKRWKQWLHKLTQNRKLRCGGFSAVLTAAAVVCALLVGALADGLEKPFSDRAALLR